MGKHYSLENMDSTVICRVFNYHSIPKFIQPWVRLTRQLYGMRDHYTLGDVYRMHDAGQNVQDILSDNEGLTLRAALLGRTFHLIHNEGPKVWHAKNYLRTMIDENIDIEHSVDGGMQSIGPTTHVAFKGLMGAKDLKLWGYLRGNAYQILVTKDSAVKPSRNTKETFDITRCAILAWKRALTNNGGVVDDNIRALPKILQVPADAKPSQIKNMLRKHKEQIANIHDECVSPVIIMTEGKVKPGIHFFEIMAGGFKKQTEALRDLRLSALSDEFEVDRVPELRRKEIVASLKRAIEHEISVELQPVGDHNNRVVYLHNAVKKFNPHTYKFSGDSEKYIQQVRDAEKGDPLNMSIFERYEAKKQAEHHLSPTRPSGFLSLGRMSNA